MSAASDQDLAAITAALTDRKRGLFVAFEGGDGSGKSTQVRVLAQRLQDQGAPVVATFEPGATELGQQLRDLVQHGPEDVDARTEALLYAADRAYHAATMIRPELARGTSVITDRYIDSSVAYQGIGRELGAEAVRALSVWATDGLLPDLVLVLDVDSEVGISRIGGNLDRLERAGDHFHEMVADHYRQAAEADPDHYVVVDAHGTPEEVHEAVVAALARALEGRQ